MIYTHKQVGNTFSIVGEKNTTIDNQLVAECCGDWNFNKTYKENTSRGLIGSIQCFDYLKAGNVIENISKSPYIGIVNGLPQWKAGISEGILTALNNSIKQQRALRYSQECDSINAEINRRDLIGDLTTDEKQTLITELTSKSQAIKDELPYYTEVVLIQV